jgi:hypothetical protein
MALAGIEYALGKADVGYVGAWNIGKGVVEGAASTTNEVAVTSPIVCAGSAQSPV